VHLCVTRERLVAPDDLHQVRWIVDSDSEAFGEPFQAGQDRGWTLEEWLELKQQGYSYCGCFQGKRLCSVAGVWRRAPDVWEVIAAGTKDEYRRRGMAKAVVYFAADRVLNHVKAASYTTSPDNIASTRTAQSVGFSYCVNLVGKQKWCALEARPLVGAEKCPLLTEQA